MTRAVLTTGANSGLGLAIAVELARKGYRSIGSVRSEAKARAVREAAAREGVEVETVLLDVTDAEQCVEVMRGLELYGLVNNAGYGLTGAIEDVPEDEARQIVETMMMAPIRLARLALPAMKAARSGRIVNISSIYGRMSTPFTGWYQGAKHGLEGLTDALRMEVGRFGVQVALVEPGFFRTHIFDDIQRDIERRGPDSDYRKGYERSLQALKLANPIMGDPRTVARLVARIMGSPLVRARYLVGNDAAAIAVAERVWPTFVTDAVKRFTFGS